MLVRGTSGGTVVCTPTGAVAVIAPSVSVPPTLFVTVNTTLYVPLAA